MSIVNSSAILSWLLRVAVYLGLLCRNSVFGRIARFCTGGTLGAWVCGSKVYRFLFVDGFGACFLTAVARTAKGSAVCSFFWRDGRLEALWETSFLCAALTWLANLPASILTWVHESTKPQWEGSSLLQMTSVLGRNTPVLVGLLLMVTMSIDHSKWDNMYAFVGVLLICVLFILAGSHRYGQRFDVKALGPYLILNMAVICCSVLISQDRWISVRFLVFQLTAFLILLLIVSSVRDYRQLRLLVILVVVGITVAALYGCYQGIVGVEAKYGEVDLSLELNQGIPGRIYSFFDNANAFAGILVMAMPLTYALTLNAETWYGRAAALISLLLCGLALAQTYSRGGWIGFAVTVVVFVAFWNWRLIPVLVIVGLCCLPILPATIYNRILSIGSKEDGSTNYRLSIYQCTFVILKDYWLQGVGLGSNVLHNTFRQYPLWTFPVHSHCLYLQIWAETGIFGLLTFLGTMLHQGKRAVKACAVADRRVKLLIAAAVSGLCGILVMGLAEYVWFYTRSLYLFWFIFAVIVAGIKIARSTEG